MLHSSGARLLGIGNAATDIICNVDDDSVLDEFGFVKGQCVFLEDHEAIALSEKLSSKNVTLLPGGSAANVVSCFAALGGVSEFVGKTAHDESGAAFKQSMDDYGITFHTPAVTHEGSASTQIFTVVTPDGERSFAACYGASHHIEITDVAIETVSRAGMVLLDGYMLMSENGPAVLKHTVDLAKKQSRDVVFLPADISVIEARADDMAYLMSQSDAVLCNTEQAMALTGAADLTDALEMLAAQHQYGCITDGANGVHGFKDGSVHAVANPYQPSTIVSTNGAGDNFAGGFLYGLSHNMPVALACRLGMYCALECLKHQSPRPQKQLDYLLNAA